MQPDIEDVNIKISNNQEIPEPTKCAMIDILRVMNDGYLHQEAHLKIVFECIHEILTSPESKNLHKDLERRKNEIKNILDEYY